MLRWKSSLKPAAATAPNENLEFTVRTTTSSEVVDLTQMTYSLSSYNCTIDWGDGSATSTATAYNDADLAHTYTTAGDYSISISGTFGTVYTSGSSQLGYGNTLRSQIISVQNVGSLNYTTADSSWINCTSLTTFNFGNVDYSGISAQGLSGYFQNCSSLTSISFGDLDTSSLTNFSSMFQGCSSLTSLDLSSFTTSSATDMISMFFGCSSLTSIDLSGLDTSNVTAMVSMFGSCSSLTSLDLSNFDTSNVTNLNSFVRDCSSLTSIDLSSFNTSSVVDGMNFMFDGCSSLTSLDLSSFNTSNLRYMRRMFYGMGGGTAQLTITGFEDFDITSLQYSLLFGVIHIGGFHEGLANTGGISTTAYDELLVNWEAQTGYATNINAHFGPSKYTASSAAATARASLVSTGWTITDGGTA